MAESTQGQSQSQDRPITGDPGGQRSGEQTPREMPSTNAPDADDDARDLAKQHGVDLKSVKGSGQSGRITKADVEAARTAKL